ncbi:glyoxalase [Dermacoccus nishinomiyaensis]|uniref:Glyoxalase n=1 Tax=Dermacoccus nishinomiyaensis TaxID=1274 RepID=A0A075JFS7_9MICO|nr:VOC family protein [Dermacoccus nishinomiyaensis]AIF40640.1 glyoxalase [Dermacoccus nishinomiyaensis]
MLTLHHVQVSMPEGREDDARGFYRDALGLDEVAKPGALAQRGGAWFRAFADDGAVAAEIHVGIDEPFVPAKRAHPALVVESTAALEALAARIEGAGFDVNWAERHTLDGYERFHCRDAFGNRVEVLTPKL